MIPWLLQHMCTLLNVNGRGSGGLTCSERISGSMFNQLLLGFAEAVRYKLPTQGPRANLDDNMGARWLDVTFLEFGRPPNSYVIGTDNGVVAARTIYRGLSENRWSAERIARLAATP